MIEDDITISPSAAADAGCTAIYDLVDAHTGAVDWWKMWEFTATPAQGWVFDHWVIGHTVSQVGPGGQSYSGNIVVDNNPYRKEEFYYDYSYIGPGWGVWSDIITAVVAVFKSPHVPTNLILRSPTNGQILCGASGTILHDA